MSEFTTFTVTWGNVTGGGQGWVIDWAVNGVGDPYNVYTDLFFFGSNLNITQYNAYSGQFELPESSYAGYCYQGICVDFQAIYYADYTEAAVSLHKYGVLQRATNNGDTLLMNPVFFTEIKAQETPFKTIILPDTTRAGTKYGFKVRSTSNITICSYMSNVSYPITTTVFTTTNSAFNGVFRNNFGNTNQSNFGAIYGGGIRNLYSEYVTNPSLVWKQAGNYFPNSNATITCNATLEGSPLVEASNSRLLYYDIQDISLSTIRVSVGQTGLQKDIYVRNTKNETVQFNFVGPLNYAIDDISGTNTYPIYTYPISPSSFACVSFFYSLKSNSSNLYITRLYSGTGVTFYNNSLGTFPTINATISSPMIFVSNVATPSNITYINAYSNSGRVTYYDIYSGQNLSSICVPSDTTGNYFATSNGNNDIRWMSNTWDFFRIATLNLGVNSNIYLPMGGAEY